MYLSHTLLTILLALLSTTIATIATITTAASKAEIVIPPQLLYTPPTHKLPTAPITFNPTHKPTLTSNDNYLIPISSWGHNHTAYQTSPTFTLPIIEAIRSQYNFPIEEAHKHSQQYQSALLNGTDAIKNLSEKDLDIHKSFYRMMKSPSSPFQKHYDDLILSLLRLLYPNNHFMAVQRMVNIRFHLPGTVTVPPHKDTDDALYLTRHPAGEVNFILAVTQSIGTSAMYIESAPDVGDYRLVELNAGELLIFDGNNCTHGNVDNVEDHTRVSIDFRAVEIPDFIRYSQSGIHRATRHNPERSPMRLAVGESDYYVVRELRGEGEGGGGGEGGEYRRQKEEVELLERLEAERRISNEYE